MAAANADVDVLDRLWPVTERLRRLLERCTDTEIALGSDVMEASLSGYGLLKVAGTTSARRPAQGIIRTLRQDAKGRAV
jgi:hypothetical protein